MRRFFAAFAATTALAAVPATAAPIEIGQYGGAMTPACSTPNAPCLAISRTTGYQAKVGTNRGLMLAPRSGRIVAWSITLAKPTDKQVAFFNKNLGGPSQAQLTVLKVGTHLRDRVKAQGPLTSLQSYFGGTATFPLVQTIPVHKGDLIALTVPTWAPALQVGLGGDTSWRASRGKDKCKDTQVQTAQLQIGDLAQYFCLYRTARLTYTATLIPYPKQTNAPKKTTPAKKKTRR